MIYLASYKSSRRGFIANMGNKLIRWVTRSQYSHTEICFGNPFDGEVECLSAEALHGGVRIKRMRLSPDRWDVLPLPDVKERDLRAFVVEYGSAGYDWIGAARSVIPFFGREHPTAWFCSEIAAHIIGIKEPWRQYPGVLHTVVEKK